MTLSGQDTARNPVGKVREGYTHITVNGTGLEARIYKDRIEIKRWYAATEEELQQHLTLTPDELDELVRRLKR